MTITPEEASYFAAFVDSEGSICISRAKNKQGKHYHYLVVSASNTHIGVLERMQSYFGGTLYLPKRGKHALGHKPCWQLSLSSRKASECLAIIRPYMIIKARQADLALRFVARFRPKTYNKISVEEASIRDAMAAEMKLLNATYHLHVAA